MSHASDMRAIAAADAIEIALLRERYPESKNWITRDPDMPEIWWHRYTLAEPYLGMETQAKWHARECILHLRKIEALEAELTLIRKVFEDTLATVDPGCEAHDSYDFECSICRAYWPEKRTFKTIRELAEAWRIESSRLLEGSKASTRITGADLATRVGQAQ